MNLTSQLMKRISRNGGPRERMVMGQRCGLRKPRWRRVPWWGTVTVMLVNPVVVGRRGRVRVKLRRKSWTLRRRMS